MEQRANQQPISSELADRDPSLADVVLEFVNSLPHRLDAMNAAIRSADYDTLRMAAHQLKGTGGGYGYPILTDKARILERHATDHSIDDCVDAYIELREICSRIVVTSS